MNVLIVDDNKMVASSVGRLLQNRGHKVTLAGGVDEARRTIEAAGEFDLVVSDMMMGDGTGADLHQWLLHTRPELEQKMVFMTGGIHCPKTQEYVDNSGVEVILKPAIERLMDLVGVQ